MSEIVFGHLADMRRDIETLEAYMRKIADAVHALAKRVLALEQKGG